MYETLIKPAIVDAGLHPLRADEEQAGGVIHKAMFERLILCEYAVADLTTANENVFYELGVRHAVRPWATQLIFAQGWDRLPFDVQLLRALPYQLSAAGVPGNLRADRAALKERLLAAQQALPDSPVFQLVEGFPDVQSLKTDVFRDRVRYAEEIKLRLAAAREIGASAVADVELELGEIALAEAAAVIDLFLSYRAVEDWQAMIALVQRMSLPLSATLMVREQFAFALNRAGRDVEAALRLEAIIKERGPSSETYGLLGRVYKDQWERERNEIRASGLLNKAIEAYVTGFEADWRDPYPGINAVTLMEIRDPPDRRQATILPVVAYAVERRISQDDTDYWNYATRLELRVLAGDRSAAHSALEEAAARIRERWEPRTTARNIRLIREARIRRGEGGGWLEEIEDQLEALSRRHST